MIEFFNSWRESPKVPADWQPRLAPGAIVKQKVRDPGVLKVLREVLPGRWMKIYHYGRDGTEVHYHQHESGKVAFVKYKRK
jgi:hypothetical protein